jgi:subtilisin family serine protease
MFEQTGISAELEPRLQSALERFRRGRRTAVTATAGADELGVIALVKDVDAWAARPDVRLGVRVGETDRGVLVTARVRAEQLEQIRTEDNVVSLKAAQTLRPALDASVPEIQAGPADLPTGLHASGGEGVVVGVVDFGADYAHASFRRPDGSTRLLGIWDQAGAAVDGDDRVAYGRFHDTAAIDAALATADPYAALGYAPEPDNEFQRGSHGTHVMDIAAGSRAGAAGVAPDADLIFVELESSDVAWQGEEMVGSEFGDSVKLVEAVEFIFRQAGDRPCVVNLSLGTNGGPHDGTSLVEASLDALIAQRPNRMVVIAASNSFEDGIHAGGRLTQGGTADLRLEIFPDAVSDTELEVWYDGSDVFEVEVLTPSGSSLGKVPLGTSARAADAQGRALLFASHRRGDPNNGDNNFGLFFDEAAPKGVWTIRLSGAQVTDGTWHAWIERSSPSAFAPPHDNTHTLGSISCGRLATVVGSYDARDGQKTISRFSSAGPTRDGREKPEVSAPGHRVQAAHSRTRDRVVVKSGTSMAAPAVTGVIALLLSEAAERGRQLDAAGIRAAMIETARNAPPPDGAWHDRYGAGRVDARGVLAGLVGG